MLALAEGITKGNHQCEYIIGTLCQCSDGPIAFASVAYYIFFYSFIFIIFIFSSLRKICQFPERLMSENIDEKDRKHVCLQPSWLN